MLLLVQQLSVLWCIICIISVLLLRRVVIIWNLDSRTALSLINMDINQRKVSQ